MSSKLYIMDKKKCGTTSRAPVFLFSGDLVSYPDDEACADNGEDDAHQCAASAESEEVGDESSDDGSHDTEDDVLSKSGSVSLHYGVGDPAGYGAEDSDVKKCHDHMSTKPLSCVLLAI